ncbi:hypothetical protein HKD37_17G048510 [Glycine soja]
MKTYQGNPCGVYPDLSSFIGSGVYPDLSSFIGSGVYPDLSSFTGSDVIQISVACIKRSAPHKIHIIWFMFSSLFCYLLEKDKAPEWRRMKAQVEKDEGPEAETLSRQLITYQGNPCGVYPDLSSFTGSGVYPDLSSFTGSGVIQTFVACIKRSAS